MKLRKYGVLVSLLIFLAVACFLRGINGTKKQKSGKIVSFIILGATGDLAKKKLWPSVIEMVVTKQLDLSRVHLYAGTRDSKEITYQSMRTYFENYNCAKRLSLDVEHCRNINDNILRSTNFVKLRDSSDYLNLKRNIHQRLLAAEEVEQVRIFYLAVPPFAYSGIVSKIDAFCRPSTGVLRVAIEKPFGRDFESARELAELLRSYLVDDEVYLVDHYLHKPGVQQIQSFLEKNYHLLKPIWNRKGIKYVEIVANEKFDVQGRTGYYDQYGAIRDMLQSHLTELMATLITGIDSYEKDKNEAKHVFLQKVTHPFIHSSFIGQYQDYLKQVMEETGNHNISTTPTYAAVLLFVQDKDWFGVPFFLSSGKSLLKREGFVRVVFHDGVFDVPIQEGCNPELSFIFNHETAGEYHNIIVSPPMVTVKSPFLSDETGSVNDNSCGKRVFSPALEFIPSQAYTSVVAGLLSGKKDLFVPLKNVLESWRIWAPLLKEIELDSPGKLYIYSSDLVEQMKLSKKGTKLITTFSKNSLVHTDPFLSFSSTGTGITLSNFLGHNAFVSSRSNLLLRLAVDIYNAALNSVAKNGVFHIALPGGSSPLELFQIMALDYSDTFPWTSTHVWQTDERCVDISSPNSNINQLRQHLLQYVNIPASNIHPILANSKFKVLYFWLDFITI